MGALARHRRRCCGSGRQPVHGSQAGRRCRNRCRWSGATHVPALAWMPSLHVQRTHAQNNEIETGHLESCSHVHALHGNSARASGQRHETKARTCLRGANPAGRTHVAHTWSEDDMKEGSGCQIILEASGNVGRLKESLSLPFFLKKCETAGAGKSPNIHGRFEWFDRRRWWWWWLCSSITPYRGSLTKRRVRHPHVGSSFRKACRQSKMATIASAPSQAFLEDGTPRHKCCTVRRGCVCGLRLFFTFPRPRPFNFLISFFLISF